MQGALPFSLRPGARLPLIIVTALLINLLLFTAIELMVGSKRVRLTPTDDFDIANFIRMQEESRDVRSRRDPNAPQKPQNEMQRDFERLSSAGSSGLGDLMLDVPQFDIDLGLELGGVALARELTPLVRVPPEYPIKALTEEIEGFVVLRFIVTETGSVEDPEVVRADPPRIFDRAALRAVTRWKFQPQIRDGKASRVVAITRVAFVLAEE